MLRRLFLLTFVNAIACAGEPNTRDTATAQASPDTSQVTAPVVIATPACPATGSWSRCAIIERLDRSGLAPRLDSAAVASEPPLTRPGFLVRVGRAELEVYLYEDQASRAREQALLDRSRYMEYTAPLTMAQQPTLIASANALAILHSRNSHLRERVGDAITAGAPAKAP